MLATEGERGEDDKKRESENRVMQDELMAAAGASYSQENNLQPWPHEGGADT